MRQQVFDAKSNQPQDHTEGSQPVKRMMRKSSRTLLGEDCGLVAEPSYLVNFVS